MKLFMLSDPASIHTRRWVAALAVKKIDIFLFGLRKEESGFYDQFDNVRVFACDMIIDSVKDGAFEKIKYLKVFKTLKRKIEEFKPDILHAHYASSYGLLGALLNFHPYIISVWGSDVYDFPQKSFLHRRILKYNLSKADRILSTSHVMAIETHKYTSKKIEVTPFGVDVDLFKKLPNCRLWDADFVVGNVKTLAPKYGIDVLIRSFRIVVDNNPSLNVKLVIIGDGPNKQEYVDLAETLGIKERFFFLGRIPNNELNRYYSSFSVAVSLSVYDSESFGVVAVEAMSCECPVITSDAAGFTEVVKDGETGFIVPKRDEVATAKMIQKFIDNPTLCSQMGKKGREHVLRLYDWEKNVETMLTIYRGL